MNERAVELYKQATEFAYNSIGREHANTAYFQGAITGKFAELIVRECAEFVDYRLTNPDGASMAWCDGLDIKQHFGVEE
jgi:hypothetical protein